MRPTRPAVSCSRATSSTARSAPTSPAPRRRPGGRRGPPARQPRTLQHGSFGAYLAGPETAAARPARHPVVLLGNSIYQGCQIAARMQRMANADADGIEFVNLAQTGSGIHDYFAQMIKSLRFRPELLVV